MFSMLTQFYLIEDAVLFIEDYGNNTIRTVVVYRKSLYCVYDNWRGEYMVVRYLCGRIDLNIYNKWEKPVRVLIPTAWYFSRVL